MKDFEKQEKVLAQLRPIDDILGAKLFEDLGTLEEVLSTILGEPIKVIRVIPQSSIKNLHGRSVILDALCERENGTYINVELQKADNDDHQKRVRYNASCITTNISETGTNFEKVPDVCIIFISTFDIFKENKTIYHIERMIRETGKVVYNGLSEIYVNTKVNDGTDISELMNMFIQKYPNNSKFPKFSERVHYFKEGKGVEYMCKELLEYREEAKYEMAVEMARDMFEMKISEEKIIASLQKHLEISNDEAKTLFEKEVACLV